MTPDSGSPGPSGQPFRITPRLVLLTAVIMIATAMQSLDGTIANIALPHIQGSMSASLDQVTWVITSYAVSAGVFTMLTQSVAQRVGRKRLYIGSIIAFTLASMLCGAAQTMEQIVLFRIVQGAAGAFLMPLSQAVILDIYPRERHTSALAVWSMGTMLAPILGPTLGGFLTEFYSWRWVFYINLPFGLLATAGLWLLLSESEKNTTAKFDLTGFALLSIAIGAFQMMLDRGTELDWFSSREIVILATISGVAFYVFLVHMFTIPEPFVSHGPFKDTNFVASMSVGFILMMVTFATTALMPTFLQSLVGYPVLTTGFILMPRGIATLIAMTLAGQILRTIDARPLIIAGILCTAVSLWMMSRFTLDVDIPSIVIVGFIQGFGMGLVFVPMSTIAFATLDRRYYIETASLFSLIRSLGGSIGVSIVATMLARNTQVNHASLAEYINPFNHILQALVAHGAMVGTKGAVMLDNEINRQAQMIAYLDVFRLMALIIASSCLLVPIMRNPKRAAAGDAIMIEA